MPVNFQQQPEGILHMQRATAVAVVGSAIHAPRDPKQRSLEEAMYAVTRSALLDAEIVIDDIDGIVVAANDQLDGRAISIMMASGSVGGVDRDIMSTPSAAEHAFVLGAMRIASGQFRTQLVVAWSPLETTSVADALKLGTDPYFHRALRWMSFPRVPCRPSRWKLGCPPCATSPSGS